MVFGWFSKKSTKEQSLAKAKKLLGQRRAAEALTFYEEALESDPACGEATEGIAACRRSLVEVNLSEAHLHITTEPDRALEHLELARKFSGGERELLAEVEKAAKELKAAAPQRRRERKPEQPAPKRMFEPSCGCASPCSDASCGEGEVPEVDDLFLFYMEGVEPGDRERLEAQGTAFREAFVALQQGESALAKAALARAKKEQKDSPVLVYAQGLLLSLEGNPAGAEKSFAQALAKDPDFTSALHHRAISLRELRRPAEAAKLLAQWLERHPDDSEARTLLTVSLFEAENFAEAKAAFAPIASARMATDPNVALLWGRINEGTGDAETALAAYSAATARKPDFVDALFPLGMLLLRQGGRGPENAVKAFKQCYKADQERGWFYLLRIAQAYTAIGWKKEAQEMLDRARDECPDHPEAHAACDEIEKLLSA